MGNVDGKCNWPRGKVMGGSSVLNYMLYVRGNRLDYDIWERDGNPGWGYRDVLHYFKKSEDNRNPYLANTHYHGAGGFLTVQVIIKKNYLFERSRYICSSDAAVEVIQRVYTLS